MEKHDWIQGTVLEAITGNSFLLKVNHVDDSHSNIVYHQTERIRINERDAPPLKVYEGILAKNRLNTRYQNKTVLCDVLKRDFDEFLLCNVKLVEAETKNAPENEPLSGK